MRENQNAVSGTFAEVVTQGITMRCVDTAGGVTTLDAVLGYDPVDPYAVTATFQTDHGDVVWTFARELLLTGLTSPAGEGDVHIWPCLDAEARAVVIVELSSPDGELTAQANSQDVYTFVNRTLASVPLGVEAGFIDVELLIDQLLRDESV